MNNDHDLDLLIKQMAAGHDAELPSPGLIWWRAQILKKQAEKERIERPVMIMRMVAVAIGLLVVIALAMSQGRGLWESLNRAGFPFLLPVLFAVLILAAASLALMWRITSQA
ncbi:MAG TPA: hypothetical protein VFP71_15455 [Candidatus Angelobacter sp.]|nr:hypothetical protein [Candidatus Angelobacter sp.]